MRPFVLVTFQGKQSRTSVAEGPNPTWNQQLILPFRAPNDDYSSISLGLVRESILLQLFDEKLVELPSQSPSFHTRLHNTWLASLTIPTSALLSSSKIEGTFELNSPMAVLGYNRPPERGVGVTCSSPSTHLTLYITLEPTLPQPQPLKGLLPSCEPEDVLRASSAWQDSLQSRYPTRFYQSHVLDTSGHLVALDRFIRPLEPPKQLLNNDGSQEQIQNKVAWFVSLIPALADMSLFPGTPNITASCNQLINMVCGGETERAHLLTNYFLHFGHKAFLLIGSSVSQARYSCVLVRSSPSSSAISEGISWRIWCPDTARSYSTKDPFCPVKSIFMLVNQENVWGNAQKWEDPSRVQFAVEDSSCWRPLYGKTVPLPGLPSLQPSSLSYCPPTPHHERELRDKLIIIVRDAFMKWRPHHRYETSRLHFKFFKIC